MFDRAFKVQGELFQTTVGGTVVLGDGLEGPALAVGVKVTLVRIDVVGGAAVRVLLGF